MDDVARAKLPAFPLSPRRGERARARGVLALLFLIRLGHPVFAAEPASLQARFIGNMAFAITDGKTTLYTDFPYQSGYAGYMTWDTSRLPAGRGDLCLITHAHPDHFERSLMARMESQVIMPPSLSATLPAARVIRFEPEMKYRDIEVEALRTPHGTMDHYSYLVTWHGLRLYFTGDTDSTEQLLAAKDLDAAFVSPWLLEAVASQNARIDARQVIVYHQTADEEVPSIQNAVVPKQGDTLVLESRIEKATRPAPAAAPDSPFRARRTAAMRRMNDGILLLPAKAFRFADDLVHAFRQDPDFFYFTGLDAAPGAVLALDGAAGQSWLFVPAKLPGLADMFATAKIPPGDSTAARLGIDRVVDRKELAGFLARRQEEKRGLILYARGVTGAHGFPLDIALDDPDAAWDHALSELWSASQVKPADAVIAEMRSIKGPVEIEALRTVGKTSAAALSAGIASLKPGRPQRVAEAAVVSACIASGAEGPSFWPWVMTGPNGSFPAPFESLVDYQHLNRAMQAGELARVDVGCDARHYQGDVGRTAPVSGKFDAGQRETWELLISAYRAGLAVFRDGARRDDVYAASLAAVRRRQPSLTTHLGRKAAEVLLSKDGLRWWGIHGVGLEAAEGAPEVLRAGMVVAFEPIFSVEDQGFYLEDMVLVTQDGHEILTPGLPYSAAEIERAVAPRETPRKTPTKTPRKKPRKK